MRYLILLLLLPAMAPAAQPASAVLLAYNDVRLNVAPYDRPYTRYLWVSENDPKLKWTRWVACSGHIQGLSLGRRIVSPLLVLDDGRVMTWQEMKPPNWQRLSLLRVNLRHMHQSREQWDKLGDPALEMVFHANTVLEYPAGLMTDGTRYAAGREKTTVIAPWVFSPLDTKGKGPAENAYLKAALGLSRITGATTPIVEARNFVWQTAIDFDRKAGYYSWLGVKNKNDFDRLTRRQKDVVLLTDAVAESGVTQEPRLISREGRGDGYWFSSDQVGQRGIGPRNALVLQRRLRFDAFEVFGRLDNGWWATGLFANDGKAGGSLQQSAPDGIGYHHGTLTNDGRIHVYLTCFVCHDKQAGHGGLHPFRPFFRSQYAAPGPIALGAFKNLEELEEQYLTPMDAWADVDRRVYFNAVAQANGLEPHQWALALYDTFHSWDRAVDLDMAAAELGVTSKAFVGSLQQYMANYGYMDAVNSNWLLPDERRTRIGRNQWAEAYPLAQLIMRGLPTWPEQDKHRWRP